MEFFDILSPDCCRADMTAKNKDQVLEELGKLVSRNPHLSKLSPKDITAALAKREEQGSTGFGDGIAIPHCQMEGADGFVLAIGISRSGVDFGALDKKPSKIFLVIIGPEGGAAEHLKILASVSRSVGQEKVRRELLAAASDQALFESFVRNTDNIRGASNTKRKMKLLVMVLYLEEFLYEILEYFMQEGVEGATIIESQGMGEYISKAPLFANFINFFNADKNQSKTILALVPEDRTDEMLEGLDKITGGMEQKQGAMAFVVDITQYRGSMEMI